MSDYLQSVLSGSVSPVPVVFCVGDTVDVLSAIRLPQEHILHTGTVERVDGDLYWVSGKRIAVTAGVLRLIKRVR